MQNNAKDFSLHILYDFTKIWLKTNAPSNIIAMMFYDDLDSLTNARGNFLRIYKDKVNEDDTSLLHTYTRLVVDGKNKFCLIGPGHFFDRFKDTKVKNRKMIEGFGYPSERMVEIIKSHTYEDIDKRRKNTFDCYAEAIINKHQNSKDSLSATIDELGSEISTSANLSNNDSAGTEHCPKRLVP